ncbi:hypothetical protein [Streptomyces actinomycinicus]|uniref:hypothetical protein n=1 Tax=Streptomyces actinomycinicus TaxID=1695166 RepID=UPI0027DAA59A|nr:hypothetical protein [Streptomyces actinomycinicus]
MKQPPHTGWLVFLRVLFVVLAIFTIGLLTSAMMLRLAAVTRRSLDWGLFVAVLAADILSITLLAVEGGDEVHTPGGYTGMVLLLVTLVAAIAYYLTADIRHFMLRQQAYEAQQQAYAVHRHATAYGYPAPATPYTATTVPTLPTPAGPVGPHTPPPMPHTPVPQPPLTAPPPQRPAPARIDQVRAELDELSDYLRKQDGHEGGR